MLLRIYEQRKNFRYLIHATSEKTRSKKRSFFMNHRRSLLVFK